MDYAALKKQLRHEVAMSFRVVEEMTREAVLDRGKRHLDGLPRDVRKSLDEAQRVTLLEELCEDLLGFGPLQTFMEDDAVTEIMVNSPEQVYIEKGGHKQPSDRQFSDEAHVRLVLEKMMRSTGRRLDESVPYADFALDDGSRVHAIIPPLAVGGAKITIRKFLDSIENVDHLVNFGTLDRRMADFLAACIKAKKNMLFSGATGSGKTTTLGALSSYIAPDERIVVIEDTLELTLQQDHVVNLLTRPPNIEGKGEVTLRDLLRNSLRMRPTRILLGEIRGAEAMDYLQALNSGHRGCLAVLHAATPTDAVTRLETMALFAGLNLPVYAIRQQIASGLELIIQQEQLHDGGRKITHVTEVRGMEGQQVVLQDLYRYEVDATEADGTVRGRFLAGDAPMDLDAFTKKGIEVSPEWFRDG